MNERASLRQTLTRAKLTTYAKDALDWSFVEKDADLYYQRMFNLAGDVVKLVAEVERLEELVEQAEVDTERKVTAEMRERLEDLHG